MNKPTELMRAFNADLNERLISNYSKEVQSDFKAHFQEASFWEAVADSSTPLDLTKEREGAFNQETGENVILEYFPEEYTIRELNRLFPGWWCEGMKRSQWEEVGSLRSFLVEGYLCVEYPTAKGKKISKKWGIGGNDVKFVKNTNKPISISSSAKAARTDWVKVTGKLYGIGLDIYHQRITTQLRSEFEDAVRDWGKYADDIKEVVNTLTTGHTFRNFLKSIPNPNQTKQFIALMDKTPVTKRDKFWLKFTKELSNKTRVHTVQLEQWLSDLAIAIDKLNNKEM